MPAEFIDRWRDRDEPSPAEGLFYWHMLVGHHPEVVALARDAQKRLASFAGLHLTPLRWLHMTMLIAGPLDTVSADDAERMAATATRLLADAAPVTVTFEKVLYHPEAIMLAATPPEVLTPVREAIKAATREGTGTDGQAAHDGPWTPHVTLCYSTSRQPSAPVIAALGRYMPAVEVQISEISLVIQHGPERHWDWEPVATVRLGGLPVGLVWPGSASAAVIAIPRASAAAGCPGR